MKNKKQIVQQDEQVENQRDSCWEQKIIKSIFLKKEKSCK